jgi:hypothetical protein
MADRAKTQARRALQQIEGAKAMAEYRAAEEFTRKRTAQLRAARLAREASASPTPAANPRKQKVAHIKVRS